MYATSQRENFKFKFSNIERWWVLGWFKPNAFWNMTFDDENKDTREKGSAWDSVFKEF